jgi:predicted Zn-dependent protease
LLGPELGHVNARHAAQRQGQAMVAQVAVTGVNIIGSAAGFGGLTDLGTQLGASALLSSYSRDNDARRMRWARNTWCAPATRRAACCRRCFRRTR